jgi:beta-lactam-binding protein with PASTA domain
MAVRVAAHLPRLVVLGLVCLFACATLTYGAAKRLSAPATKHQTQASAPTVVVPDVTGQAFVFAKGALEDAGFAWKVIGSVHGYAANRVVTQSPAAGTKLKDTGAPTVTVSLSRASYAESGEPEDTSPYIGTAVVPVRPVVAPLVRPATSTKRVAPTTHQVARSHKAAVKPAARPPAFVVTGAPKEPLKEMPLPDRAQRLSRWLSSHPKPTNANVRHFLYQNAWITTGAKFGWWHGAEAVKLLIAADQQAERLWGIGKKSELAARHVLAEVKARSR